MRQVEIIKCIIGDNFCRDLILDTIDYRNVMLYLQNREIVFKANFTKCLKNPLNNP